MNDINWNESMTGIATHNHSIQMTTNKSLAPDRFLQACPIKYECRNLFIYLIEMEYCQATKSIETMLQYPEKRDQRNFSDDRKLNEFIENVKKFAYPYAKTLNGQMMSVNTSNSNSLVQFYTFVFTDANRIRQYGFCRSAQAGQHIIAMISYLPWYNVFINILNKVSTIINEKDTTSLYHFLEALYEYELPEPGNYAQIFSHDGLDQMRFQCPDRRVIPSINENRNLLKFFAFFDLEKIIKIFTALLLERSILIVSKDLENLTSCALASEYLLYPLEWLHTFVPIMPEHIDLHVFNQPFPFIYGVHTCIYEKLNKSQLDQAVILLVDEKQVLNGDQDQLPENIVNHLIKKLKYFQEAESNYSGYGLNNTDNSYSNSSSSSSSASATNPVYSFSKINVEKYDLLRTGPIKAFLDSVLMIIDDYREYLCYDEASNEFKLNENIYFQMKNVYNDSNNNSSLMNSSNKYISNKNEFYHEFRITQSFEEFCRDRCDYLKSEKQFNLVNQGKQFPKDFIETLADQFNSDNQKLPKLIDKGLKNLEKIRNKLVSNAKEKSIVKKLFNSTPSSSKKNQNSTSSKLSIATNTSNQKMVTSSLTDQSLQGNDTENSKSLPIVSIPFINNGSIKSSSSKKIIGEAKSLPTDKSKKKKINKNLNLDFSSENNNNERKKTNGEFIGLREDEEDNNEEKNADENDDQEEREEEQQLSSESSSTTSESMSSLNKMTDESNNNIKRQTISNNTLDLINDPDLRKFFENTATSTGQDNKKNVNDDTVFNLIDISSTSTSQTESSSNSINKDFLSQTSQSIEDNPFVKDRFIDQFLDETLVANKNMPKVQALAPMPLPTQTMPPSFTNSILNPTSMIKANNSLKKETLPTPTSASVSASPAQAYKSIIDEFDPILSLNDADKQKSPVQNATPVATTTLFSQNNYQNLTARPFQNTYHQNPQPFIPYQQQQHAPKPNYHITLPTSSSIQQMSNLNSSNTKMPSSQSQNFTTTNRPSINPFLPTPYYAFNANYHEQTYRPVQFINNNNNNNNNLMNKNLNNDTNVNSSSSILTPIQANKTANFNINTFSSTSFNNNK